jgi:hypothetical protein
MKNLAMLCLCAVVAQLPLLSSLQAAERSVQAAAGSLLYSEDGRRLGAVYKVNENGSVKLIYNNKIVVIPANMLSEVNGKLTTSLTKDDIRGMTL